MNSIEKFDTIFEINENGQGPKLVQKKSKFIASAFVIKNKDDIKPRISEISKQMKKASHNAYAVRILTSEKKIWDDSSDDGEVPGTAGKSILYILEKQKIVNILIIVTRYYGGIHLGPAGLMKMYGGACKDIIERIGLNELD